MKVKSINIDGNKSADVELSDKIFSLKPNKSIIQSMIYWQQNHSKPNLALALSSSVALFWRGEELEADGRNEPAELGRIENSDPKEASSFRKSGMCGLASAVRATFMARGDGR